MQNIKLILKQNIISCNAWYYGLNFFPAGKCAEYA